MAAPAAPTAKVAEDLSRMEGEYGAKMLGKLKQMHVLIIGLRGLGVETAKNLILAGPHTVNVWDEGLVAIADLGTNFYLLPEDVGQSRAQASLRQLGELNPNVNVGHVQGAITGAEIQKYDVVCVTDSNIPLATLCEWNQAARTRFRLNPDTGLNEPHSTAFIAAGINGVSGFVFSDFGDEFHVFDPDGLPVRHVVIDHITRSANGVVTIDGDRHLLSDGDLLKFEEVRGMSDQFPGSKEHESDIKTFKLGDTITDINSIIEIKTTKSPKRFAIGNTMQLGEYLNGGVATQIKQGKTFKFQSLAAQMVNPAFISGYMDFTKFGRDAVLHMARYAIWQFQAKHGRFPALHSEADADAVVALAQAINAEHGKAKQGEALVAELDLNVVRQMALYWSVELSPLAALFGGVVAQEITKQTGKYSPLTQFFHYDAMELLAGPKPPVDSAPLGSRYDHQIAVFGRAVQEKLQRQNVFLVGCGALGCEYIKAFALMGLGVKGGSVHMTDDDRIELSNLSRQFLFRRKHVGHSKSTSAAEAAVAMNPDLRACLMAMENRVEPKSEDIFTDAFWDRLDFIVNALDNQQARKYVDGKCVIHKKPLFESGTLGTQANSVICLPYKTPSYTEGAVAGEEQGIAKCTLRNFPSIDLHCIEWAREKFDDLFVSGADAVNSLLEDREQFLLKLKQDPLSEADALKSVQRWLSLAAAPSFDQCCRVMLDEFLTNYRNAINDLTHAFPADARIKDATTGADLGLFWHGHKRFPRATEFDIENPAHVEYVFHGANILASVFRIPEQGKEAVRTLLPKLLAATKPWEPSGAKIVLDEDKSNPSANDEKKEATPSEEDHAVVARLTQELRALDLSKYKPLVSADFEKDNDFNHHIDWITSSTNLRCWNYHIKETTRQKCRMISGKIIPAIATTTATITGFIGVEMYKYVMGAALESFRAASINLASNVFCVENLPDPNYKKSGLDPQTYMQVVAVPERHTIWDSVVIDGGDGSMTLSQFIDRFAEVHHGCVIDTLIPLAAGGGGGKVLYNGMDALDKSKKDMVAARMNTPLVKLWEEIVGPIFPPDRSYLLFDCSVEDESGNPGIVPTIRFNFRK